MVFNVVITGSSKGIGFALANEFIRLGDNVIISSSNEERTKEAVKKLKEKYVRSNIFGQKCDVTKTEDLEQLVQFAVEKLGSIDIWINNAGIANPYKSLDELELEEIAKVLEINVLSVLNASKIVLRQLKKQKYGKIFNVAGMGSDGRPAPKLIPYAASKSTIPIITKSLSKELKEYKIQVNYIHPAMTLTDIITSQLSPQLIWIFNILGDIPKNVAQKLVPKMKKTKKTGKGIYYSKSLKVFWKFATAVFRKERYITKDGQVKFENEVF